MKFSANCWKTIVKPSTTKILIICLHFKSIFKFPLRILYLYNQQSYHIPLGVTEERCTVNTSKLEHRVSNNANCYCKHLSTLIKVSGHYRPCRCVQFYFISHRLARSGRAGGGGEVYSFTLHLAM